MPAEARDTGLTGEGVTGGCESAYQSAGSKTPVIYKSSQNSAHLSTGTFLKNAAFSPLSHTLLPSGECIL